MPSPFRYITNLASHTVKEIEEPWNVKPAPALPKGDARLKWMVDSTTDHVFLTMFEGMHPGMRVGANNEAVKMWGVIADYDCDSITDEMLSAAGRENPALAPTWTTRSMSPGRARLVWEFSEGVWLPPTKKAQQAFLKKLTAELDLSGRLPSYDPSSTIPTQHFEVGHSWVRTGASPLPADIVALWLMEAAKRGSKEWGEGPEIPLEDVGAEVEKRWPGRWAGSFMEGARGPLFFVEPFEDRVGCQVAVRGLVCYSTRAPSAFVSWSELLGRDFVRTWEADRTGAVAQDIWYDGKSYWWRNEGWSSRNKEDSIMHLKGRGLSAKIDGAKQTISEAERVLLTIQEQRTIDFAAPILFDRREIVNIHGERVLNISRRQVMQPADIGGVENYPWLWNYLCNCWDDSWRPHGVSQRDWFRAWHKRFWQAGYEGRPAQGHLLVLAGPNSIGKTLLNKWMIGESVGGSVDAVRFLQGLTDFNKQAGEMALWRIDDGTSTADERTKRKFGETLKRHVANPTVEYHPKFRDSVELPWVGRIVLTCNIDPESLGIIPPPDNTIKDKLMILKLSDGWMPRLLPTNEENEERIVRELPFYLRDLLDWEIPETIQDPVSSRFGIKAVHHPEILAAALEGTTTYSTLEALEIWIQNASSNTDVGEWTGTASQLLAEMKNSPHGNLMGNTNPVWFGRDLRKLKNVWSPMIKVGHSNGCAVYHICVKRQ